MYKVNWFISYCSFDDSNFVQLIVVASSEAECRTWIQALEYLLSDTLNSPYPLHVDTLLRKEIYKIPGEKYVIVSWAKFHICYLK